MASRFSLKRVTEGLPPAFVLYAALLVLIAAPFVPAGLRAAAAAPVETLVWTVFLSAAGVLTIPMLPKAQIDASLGAPVAVAAAVLLPPPLAFLIGLLGLTSERELKRGVTPLLIVFNHAQFGLSTGAAALAAHLQPFGPIAGTVLAVLVFTVVNTLAMTMYLWTRGRARLPKAAKDTAIPFAGFAVDFGFVTLLALLIVVAYGQVGPWAVFLLAMPLWLGYRALRSARIAEDRAEELAARVRELETLNRLGTELLTVRDRRQVAAIVGQAVSAVIGSPDVEVSLAGVVGSGQQVVKIPRAEPAAIGVPPDVSEGPMAVVEAICGLAGMALQRLELEEELAENQRALTRLSAQILEEGTHERSRIALEIHDDVLPYLAAAEIQADNVRSSLLDHHIERADRLAKLMHDAVHDGIARLREVLEALRQQIIVPGALRQGLADALADLRLKHGVDGQLEAPDPLPPLPLAVEILVLETVRGCLTNVARHAAAKNVVVSVEATGRLLRVAVCDDGKGFDPTGIGPGHHGLALMAQRVELARGRFLVDSAPNEGTRVQVEVQV